MENRVVARGVAARIAALSAAVPDLGFVAVALTTWIAPSVLPAGTMRWLGNVMAFEFVILHAAGVVIIAGSKRSGRARWVARAGLLTFYTLLASWISYGIGAWWPIATFALLMVNQFLPFLRESASHDRQRQFAIRWITATLIWLGATLVTSIVPVPRLGLTESVVAILGPGGDGLWEREPHRLVVATAIYFGAVAWREWRNGRKSSVTESGATGGAHS